MSRYSNPASFAPSGDLEKSPTFCADATRRGDTRLWADRLRLPARGRVRGSRRQLGVKYWPQAVNSCILNPKNICHWEAYEARLPWIHLCPVVGCMGAASSQSST